MCAPKRCKAEMSVAETCKLETCMPERCTAETCMAETCKLKTRTAETCKLEMCTAETSAAEMSVAETRKMEPCMQLKCCMPERYMPETCLPEPCTPVPDTCAPGVHTKPRVPQPRGLRCSCAARLRGASPGVEAPHRRRRPPPSPCFVLPNLESFFTVQTRLCRKAMRSGGGELAELIGDMKGHVRREIPLFREQTAAEIDFFPVYLSFSPLVQRRKALHRDYLLRSANAICWMCLLLTGTENSSQSLSIFFLFFPFTLILSSFFGF